MNEELFVEQVIRPDGTIGVFKCVKSQLWKTKGKSPLSGKLIFAEMDKP